MTTNWETAIVNKDGTKFAFLDSGAVEGETYTTIVCIHGHSYHAKNFERLFPSAASHNLRIIALNRRDYIGSTPFTQEELDAINSSDPSAHAAFLQNRGLEIAQFLVWLVNEKRIPKASEDGKAGGLAVLGWSLGNVFAIAFVRHLISYPEEIVQALAPYLRTAFVYEAAYSGMGYPRPEGAYQPLVDPDIPERARGMLFGIWVSSYFSHPCYASLRNGNSEPPEDLDSISKRITSIADLQMQPPDVHPGSTTTKRPTIEVLTGPELKESIDTAPDARSERPFWTVVKRDVLYENALGTFISPNQPSVPKIKLRYVYCLSSVWSAQWGAFVLKKDVEKWKAEGKELRELRFVPVEGGNHFLHYEEPDRLLRILAEGVSS